MTDRECVHGSLESLCPTCKTSSDVGGEKFSQGQLAAMFQQQLRDQRERIAAMAMQGILASTEEQPCGVDVIAETAVQYADALIAELAK
jgi:hypothetical protein